eukprot:258820-Rhodomonas_salina.1
MGEGSREERGERRENSSISRLRKTARGRQGSGWVGKFVSEEGQRDGIRDGEGKGRTSSGASIHFFLLPSSLCAFDPFFFFVAICAMPMSCTTPHVLSTCASNYPPHAFDSECIPFPHTYRTFPGERQENLQCGSDQRHGTIEGGRKEQEREEKETMAKEK